MSEMKVTIGQAFPKEEWLAARDDLKQLFPVLAEFLIVVDHEGKGKQDAAELMHDAMMALQAMTYVAEFAADKCRFLFLPGGKKRGNSAEKQDTDEGGEKKS